MHTMPSRLSSVEGEGKDAEFEGQKITRPIGVDESISFRIYETPLL